MTKLGHILDALSHLFFYLAADALVVIIERANQNGFVK